MKKEKLDELLEKHKAQPVGHGYIDIIVHRDNYKSFIKDLVNNGFQIESVSWWEWCQGEKENNYGLGGPRSRYYDGWFSELPIDVDEIIQSDNKQDDKLKEILARIEAKSISYSGETITFRQNEWLTPAVWIDVPDDWRNEYCA